MEVNAFQWKLGGKGDCNFTRRNYVQPHALFGSNLDHVGIGVGLAGVERERVRVIGVERIYIAAHVGAQGRFVINIERRPELSRQLRHRHTADGEHAGVRNLRRNRQHLVCYFNHLSLAPN